MARHKKGYLAALVIGGVVLVLGIAIYRHAPLTPSTQRGDAVTIYPILCEDTATDFVNCKNPYAEGRTTYEIDVQKQQVSYSSPDSPSIPVKTTSDCTITDVQNWRCKYPDGSGNFGMEHGSYFADESMHTATTIYATQKEWVTSGGNL